MIPSLLIVFFLFGLNIKHSLKELTAALLHVVREQTNPDRIDATIEVRTKIFFFFQKSSRDLTI